MTPEQVSGFFDAGEAFVEGTIGAALVALWLLTLALHMARPYMVRNLHKFSLRLGADLWWIIYVGLRDVLLVQVFLGSIIFFYPDVIGGQELPITGGLAAACAFGVMVIKLTTKGDQDVRWFKTQTLLLALGSILYIGPYLLGVQMTSFAGDAGSSFADALVSARNPDLALPLCYLSAAIVGLLGLYAVIYNLRSTTVRSPRAGGR
jgi:hypothetical protein